VDICICRGGRPAGETGCGDYMPKRRVAAMTVQLAAAGSRRRAGRSPAAGYQRLRLATAGVVACSIGLPIVELSRIASGWTPSPGHAVPALVATACYLPLHVRHVWYAARGRRPAGAGWTLAAMAVVVIGALPVIGTSWLIALPMLAVSVLVTVRPPWSFPAAAGLVSAPAPLAVVFGDAEWAPLYTAAVLWQGTSLFVLVWLIGVARRLQAARLALAEEAVAQERLRLDGELNRTLGAALERIVTGGRQAAGLAGRDPAAAATALRTLVAGSRATLTEARRVVTRYQEVSLRAELDTAASLLRAGGVHTRLKLPPGGLPERLEAAERAALREAVSRLLRDGTVRHCTISVTQQDGRLRLDLQSDGPRAGVAGGAQA
jgi:two-component system, NarL family, sensor histidine kinase DesK